MPMGGGGGLWSGCFLFRSPAQNTSGHGIYSASYIISCVSLGVLEGRSLLDFSGIRF